MTYSKRPPSPRVIEKTDAEWKASLTREEYYILREKGTERAFTGEYWAHFRPSQYVCRGCRPPLFNDLETFDSHCGWPSFFSSAHGDSIEEIEDRTHGMIRTEVVCKKCGGHLGHVFNDGPEPTGVRYCINSPSILFQPSENLRPKT